MNQRYENGYPKMAVCPLTVGGGWQQEPKMDLYYIHVDRKASRRQSPGRLVFAERIHRQLP